MLIVLGLLGCALGNAGARWMRPIGHSQSHSADESIRFADPGRAGYPVVQPRSGVLRVQAQGVYEGSIFYEQAVWWRVTISREVGRNEYEDMVIQDYGDWPYFPGRGRKIPVAFDDSFQLAPGIYRVYLALHEQMQQVDGTEVDYAEMVGNSFITEVR
jgi:hypothetical protein